MDKEVVPMTECSEPQIVEVLISLAIAVSFTSALGVALILFAEWIMDRNKRHD